jgi:hypothetical protein
MVCDACKAIFTGKFVEDERYEDENGEPYLTRSGLHHQTLTSITNSLKEDCRLCRKTWEHFELVTAQEIEQAAIRFIVVKPNHGLDFEAVLEFINDNTDYSGLEIVYGVIM